jgi:hypothetical protein
MPATSFRQTSLSAITSTVVTPLARGHATGFSANAVVIRWSHQPSGGTTPITAARGFGTSPEGRTDR